MEKTKGWVSNLQRMNGPRISRLIVSLPAVLLLMTMAFSDANAEEQEKTKDAYPRVYRTFMPDAGPSAFAVELSPTVALCYDPLRGGVNQIWAGGIDLSPTFEAKINNPAKPTGPVFYVEKMKHPLRLGDSSATQEHRFKGYRYEDGAVVFEFTLQGLPITETLRLSKDGRGVMRVFTLPASGGVAFFNAEAQDGAVVSAQGGTEISPGRWQIPSKGRFTLLITPIQP